MSARTSAGRTTSSIARSGSNAGRAPTALQTLTATARRASDAGTILGGAGIRRQRFSATSRRPSCADYAMTPGSSKLSKACPRLEPGKQAGPAARLLIFDLELFDIGRLRLGGLDPLLHFRGRHHHGGVGREL